MASNVPAQPSSVGPPPDSSTPDPIPQTRSFTPLMHANGNNVDGNSSVTTSARDSEEPGGRRSANALPRGVANLTPEQLSRKRANDRVAQREARKRTKSRIDELEQRVHELESQPLYQELQDALRQKECIQEENGDLRRRLTSIMTIVQPSPNGTDASENTSAARPVLPSGEKRDVYKADARPQHSHYSNNQEPHSPASHSSISSHHPPSHHGHYDAPLRTPASLESGAAPTNYTGSPRSAEETSPTNAHGPRQNWPSSTSQPREEDQEWAMTHALDSQKRNLVNNLEFSGDGERLGLNFLVGSSRRVPKTNGARRSPSLPSSSSMPTRFANNPFGDVNTPPHSIPVRNVESTCPLDSILLDFLRTRQREAAEGASKRQLVGPPYPSVSSLLNPSKSAYSHPLSKVFTDILRTFPDISSLPEQVAVLYIMFIFMRWQIYPTQENYDRLPHWLTPRASQLFAQHPAWMDYLPWPNMRDRVISSYNEYEFSNWFVPYTTTVSVNWPYEATDALLSTPDSEELMINPVFETHLRNLNNWSLGPEFARSYPNLADTVRIKHEGKESGL